MRDRAELEGERKSALAPFECIGVDFTESTGENSKAVCPFCDDEEEFSANNVSGQFVCNACHATGNVITFLTKISDKYNHETNPKDFLRLAHLRGLPTEAFKHWQLGFNAMEHEWYIPIRGATGNVRDIRRWNYEKTMSTWGCRLQLMGLFELMKAPKGTTVWICEGEWDCIALSWLLKKADRAEDVCVGVPGAMVFKEDWAPAFQDMMVRICFDNDDAGDAGSKRTGEKIGGKAKQIQYLHWPESRPQGWDLNDFVSDGLGKKITAQDAIGILELLLRKHARHDASVKPEIPKIVKGNKVIELDKGNQYNAATIEDVLKTFRKWVKLDQDLEDSLILGLAVCLANDVPGDPIWLQIVAPPGSGKTLMLMALQTSDRVVFKSTLTPASLVSGFNVNPDPSLLPQLNGKCAVFKDGTELLALHPDAKSQIYGVLRGAFDGQVNKSFGNGVQRNYVLHFNMLMGITPAVHADNLSSMGERFLKFEMTERKVKDLEEGKIRSAIEKIAREMKMEDELGDVCRRFLFKQVDLAVLPRLNEEYIDRIIALAQITSMLRAVVDRERFGDRDIKYRPSYESGTRLGKQLSKLAALLCVVLDRKEIDRQIYRIVFRVACDSMIGFHRDIIKGLLDVEEKQMLKGAVIPIGEMGITREDLAAKTAIASSSIHRKLQDLEALHIITSFKVVNPKGNTNRPVVRWKIGKEILALWERANHV